MSTQMAMFYGLSERNRILDAIREDHSIYLTTLRSFAREHALQYGTVCIDDVRKMLIERDYPMPRDLCMKCGERVFGVVFSHRDFVPICQKPSTRPERIARAGVGSSQIWVYRLRQEVA
jgi:hypothetical protein